MATYNKFNKFVQDLANGVHNFGSHTFKIMMTNAAPVATATVKANLTEIAAGSGYTAGGTAMPMTQAMAAGTLTVSGTNVVFTAAGGSVGPMRYAVLYNDTAVGKPLVAWWDYGSSITLNTSETLTVQPDAVNGVFQVS